MKTKYDKCPLEKAIGDALHQAAIPFEGENHNAANLDFYLVDKKIYIEVKAGHSPRISNQMARAENVIAIQGAEAVKFFVKLLTP